MRCAAPTAGTSSTSGAPHTNHIAARAALRAPGDEQGDHDEPRRRDHAADQVRGRPCDLTEERARAAARDRGERHRDDRGAATTRAGAPPGGRGRGGRHQCAGEHRVVADREHRGHHHHTERGGHRRPLVDDQLHAGQQRAGNECAHDARPRHRHELRGDHRRRSPSSTASIRLRTTSTGTRDRAWSSSGNATNSSAGGTTAHHPTAPARNPIAAPTTVSGRTSASTSSSSCQADRSVEPRPTAMPTDSAPSIAVAVTAASTPAVARTAAEEPPSSTVAANTPAAASAARPRLPAFHATRENARDCQCR